MISIRQFSIFNMILAAFSLITTTLAFIYAVTLLKRKNIRILLIYAGNMLGFIINLIAVFMGLSQVFIFGNFENVPISYCITEGYLRITGIFLFNIYQVLIDVALYLNIYHFKAYKQQFYHNIETISIFTYSFIFLFCTIFLILSAYGKSNPFIELDCSINEVGGQLSFGLAIFIEVVQPIFAFFMDIFTIFRIVQFYKQFEYQQQIKKRIKAFILFPLTYSIIMISELLSAYFLIQSNYDPINTYVKPTEYTTKIILQGICFILVSLRGGIIACVFGNLIKSSQNCQQNIEFTIPIEDDLGKFQSFQMTQNVQVIASD